MTSKISLLVILVSLTIAGCGAPPPTGLSGRAPGAAASANPAIGSEARGLELALPVNETESTRARFWDHPAALPAVNAGIVFVSGVDGGFVEPVDGIYARTADALLSLGVPSVFVRYRQPGVLDPSVEDALAAARYLRSRGARRIAVVGWSFGGAVMIHATASIPEAVTGIGFSAQSRDTEAVAGFTTQSLLLFHSKTDENVPYSALEQIAEEVPSGIHAEYRTLEDGNHYLEGLGTEIDPIVKSWLYRELGLTGI